MKLIDFIICDDIRREISNKLTLVGTYNDRIEFVPNPGTTLSWPLQVRFACYIRLLNSKNLDFNIINLSFRLNDEEFFNLDANLILDKDPSKPIILSFFLPTVEVKKPSSMTILFKFKKDTTIIEEFKPDLDFKFSIQGT